MNNQGIKKLDWPKIIAVVALLSIVGLSLYIRIVLPYKKIFVDGEVWFRGTDPYYFMRHIENAAHNFPHVNTFDPYKVFPGGGTVLAQPFFVFLGGAIVLLFSFGSLAPHTVEVIGACIPPVLGTLTVVAVFFVGKVLFNKWVGLMSAALLIILPGEFLNRSLLGFTDHHVVDSLLFTVSILFFIMAIRLTRERKISLGNLLQRDWPAITRPLIYSLIGGVFLGMHILSWKGALLLIFILFVYLVIQGIVDHLNGEPEITLCSVSIPYFLIAFIIYLPYLSRIGSASLYTVSLLVAMLASPFLYFLSRFMLQKGIKAVYYLPILIGLAVLGLAAFRIINPSLLHGMLARFSPFNPGGAALTIQEVHPLLYPFGAFSWDIAWFNFTTSFFLAFIAIGLLVYDALRRRMHDRLLFLIWSIATLAAVLGQRRFGDYFTVSAALLMGYLSWRVLTLAGINMLQLRATKTAKAVYISRAEKRRKQRAGINVAEKTPPQRWTIWLRVALAAIAIFFFIFFPSIGLPGIKTGTVLFGHPVSVLGHQLELKVKLTQALAREPTLINNAWHNALEWFGNNSPEPFDNPENYYERYEAPYEFPESAYGVMSWWDYGYWIMQISHRIPNSNPGGSNRKQAGSFLTSQNEESANQIMNEMGSKYVIIDYPMPTSKFYAMPAWAGGNVTDYYDSYYVPQEEGNAQHVSFFYPSYYQSAVARLYNFDGKAVVPKENAAIVLSWQWDTSTEGQRLKKVIGSWAFNSYEDAEVYIASQQTGNYVLGNNNPFVSPIPLEEMQSYELVYSSPQTTNNQAYIKIFEYTGE
jgi:oligosaccharyl transferase (archaeosortase A-associated)